MNNNFRNGFEKNAGMKQIMEKLRKAFTGKMFPKSKMKDSTSAWDALRKKELKAKS